MLINLPHVDLANKLDDTVKAAPLQRNETSKEQGKTHLNCHHERSPALSISHLQQVSCPGMFQQPVKIASYLFCWLLKELLMLSNTEKQTILN